MQMFSKQKAPVGPSSLGRGEEEPARLNVKNGLSIMSCFDGGSFVLFRHRLSAEDFSSASGLELIEFCILRSALPPVRLAWCLDFALRVKSFNLTLGSGCCHYSAGALLGRLFPSGL